MEVAGRLPLLTVRQSEWQRRKMDDVVEWMLWGLMCVKEGTLHFSCASLFVETGWMDAWIDD